MKVKVKRIECGGNEIQVQVEDTFCRRTNCDGTFSSDLGVITLDAKRNKDRMASVFWHETMEAINHIWLNDCLGHETVNTLGEAFHQVIKSIGVEIQFEE